MANKKAVIIQKNEECPYGFSHEPNLLTILAMMDHSIASFARKALIPYKTFYDIVKKGAKPRKMLAKRICYASDGKITMRHFGYE